MFTVAEARALQKAAIRSKNYEKTIDDKLRETIVAGRTEYSYVCEDSKEVATYLQNYYDAGWYVVMEEVDRDRAFSAPTYYKLRFTLPPEPERTPR